MGHQQSAHISKPRHQQPIVYRNVPKRQVTDFVSHECILRLRSVPFQNSIQISSSPELFMQDNELSLTAVLQPRINSTRLFTEQDVYKLMECTLYALAYLQSKDMVYYDLVADNIFYDSDSETFKLLPPEIIKTTSYQMILDNSRFCLASPQMIIGLRCGETHIQHDIYHKSNVFTLGMILLEFTTLKHSYECYDQETFDVLDKIIKERLQLVQELYEPRVYKYISLMLDYDYTERPDPKELSILLYKELNQSKTTVRQSKVAVSPAKLPKYTNETTNNPGKMLVSQVYPVNSVNRISNPPFNIATENLSDRYEEAVERETPKYAQIPVMINNPYTKHNVPTNYDHNRVNKIKSNLPHVSFQHSEQSEEDRQIKPINKNYRQSNFYDHSPTKTYQTYNNSQEFRSQKLQKLPYIPPAQKTSTVFKPINNGRQQADSPIKRRYQHNTNPSSKAPFFESKENEFEDHSISRIKEEIQKSRRLVLELKQPTQ